VPPPPKHFDAIVDAAVRLFRQKGYAATGLADIVAASGAQKGSLYHYFPGGKAAIGAAAVQEAGRRILETVRELAASSASAGDLVKAHAGLLAQWMGASGYRDGAPMTTVLLENAPGDEAITAAGRQALGAWSRKLETKLRSDRIEAERAARLASLTISALDGALVQARVEQSPRPLHVAAEELAALFKAAAN
jgi:TetR/AcrR family transcriptional regulator, lmrAB and yxaGH operons repressor